MRQAAMTTLQVRSSMRTDIPTRFTLGLIRDILVIHGCPEIGLALLKKPAARFVRCEVSERFRTGLPVFFKDIVDRN